MPWGGPVALNSPPVHLTAVPVSTMGASAAAESVDEAVGRANDHYGGILIDLHTSVGVRVVSSRRCGITNHDFSLIYPTNRETKASVPIRDDGG